MRYLSVCSGIEAASVAWHPLGWVPLAFSEIEPFPRKVLAHHYPDVPCHGDFTTLKDQPWIKDADLLVGGTPCQAFSVAGLRQSLADDRGNLSLEFVRLANAIDASRPTPSVIIWENVPGVLSVSDNAFGCFLGALVGNDAPLVPTGGKWTNAGMVVGPQRSAAWRILDAQYFGVAQRRRRVFVVASARDGFDPAEVLFEREGLRRHSPPSRETRENSPSVTGTLTSNGGGLNRPAGNANELDFCIPCNRMMSVEVVGALGARTGLSKGVQDAQCGHMLPVSYALQHAQIGRKDSAGPQGKGWQEEVAFTQDSFSTADAVAYSIMPMNSGKDYKARETDIAQPLMTNPVGGNQGGDYVVAFHPTQDPISSTDGSTHALGCGSSQGQASVAVAVMRESGQGYWMQDDVAGTLRAEGENRPSRPSHAVAFAQNQLGEVRTGDIFNTLNTNSNASGRNTPMISQSMAVRRLTPRECERLQGFPDDYTAIPGAADGPRYKALGNSMAVPVMHWIGERIQKKVLVTPRES